LPEAFFPVRYDFDGDGDIGNNKANYTDGMVVPAGTVVNPLVTVRFDQRPTVYFHLGPGVNIGGRGYVVYEYWLYYVHNPWVNTHSHDWEVYFVYESQGHPEYIGLGYHRDFHLYRWSDVVTNGTHPHLHVDKGSHAMRTGNHRLGKQPIHAEIVGVLVEAARRLGVDISRTPVPDILNLLDSPEDGVTITWDGQVAIPPHMGGGTVFQNYRIDWQLIEIHDPPAGLPVRWGEIVAPWGKPIWGNPPTGSAPCP